jgi:hypothetical protein
VVVLLMMRGADAQRTGGDGGLEMGTRGRQGSQGVRPSPPWLARTGPVPTPTCRLPEGDGTFLVCTPGWSHAAMFQ